MTPLMLEQGAERCTGMVRVMIYLNHAGTSWPKAPPVAAAVQRTLQASPSEHGTLFESARERIAANFGIDTPSQLLLTPGCTAALSAILHSFSWNEGDVVITSAVEHEAVLGPIAALGRLRGVLHRPVAYRMGAPFDLADFDEALREGPVRVVAISAASNVTGERLPLDAIIGRAKEHGVPVVVDAAQTAGLVPVDVRELGADAIAFAGHKGPLGPQGIGGLWVRPGLPLAKVPDYCAVGSVNLAGAVGLAASLDWLASEYAPPRDRGIRLRSRLAAQLRGRAGVTVLGSQGPSTGALSLQIDGLPMRDAESAFAARGIVVRAGRHCAPQATAMLGYPEGTLRLSFGVFNDERDVDAVLETIAAHS